MLPLRKDANDVIAFKKADPAKGEEQVPVLTVTVEGDPVATMAGTWMEAIGSRYIRKARDVDASAFVLDHWVPMFGIAPAFEACLQICARLEEQDPTKAAYSTFHSPQYQALTLRLVSHVAAAPSSTWSELRVRAEDYEDLSLRQRALLAVCFPIDTANLDEMAAMDRSTTNVVLQQLMRGVLNASQLAELEHDRTGLGWTEDRIALATLVHRLGNDLVLPIDRTLAYIGKYRRTKKAGKDYATALAAIGTSDALAVLFSHGGVLPACAAMYRKASEDYPEAAKVGVAGLLGTDQHDRAEAELAGLGAANGEEDAVDQSDLPHLLREPPWTRDTAIKVANKEWPLNSSFEEPRMLTVDHVPARQTKIPDHIAVGSLTRPVTNDGVTVPLSSMTDVVTMLIYGVAHRGSPTRALLLAELEPTSTAAMLRDIFRQWVQVGMPKNGSWIMSMQRHGDDATVEMLAEYIKEWPANGRTVKAKNAAREMGHIGSDAAIASLASLSKAIRSKDVRSSIDFALRDLAEERGVSREQLEDQFVPDFGLDADGTLELDLGDRKVTLFLDEQLRPLLREPDGTIRKTFPKPTSDKQKWQQVAAKGRFTRLRKEVKAVAKLQLQRLESSMTADRRWTYAEFRRTMVEHALLVTLARRLVWGVYDETGVVCFRVAEDGTYADADDAAVRFDDDAEVGLVHPAHLDDAERARWGEVLADYELLQPFDQLGRQVFVMTEAERASVDFTRFTDGREHVVYKLIGLEKQGWERGTRSEAYVVEMRRAVSGGRYVSLMVDGGIYAPHLSDSEPSKITSVKLSTGETFATLGLVEQSELIRDLQHAFGAE